VVGNTDVGYSDITNIRVGIDSEKKVKHVATDMCGVFNMLSEIVVRHHTVQTSIDCVYACEGSDLRDPSDEERARYQDGSHRSRKRLEEAAKAEAEAAKAQEEARTKSEENAKRQDVAGTSKEVDSGDGENERDTGGCTAMGKAEAHQKKNIAEAEKRAQEENRVKMKELKKKEARKSGKNVPEIWKKKRISGVR